MAYDIGDKRDRWLELMKDSTFFGCTIIDFNSLPTASYKAGVVDYSGNDEMLVSYTSLLEGSGFIESHIKGIDEEGEVALEVTNINNSGFTVKAAKDCTIYYIVGYDLNVDEIVSGAGSIPANDTTALFYHTPLPESTKKLVLYTEGLDIEGSVTLQISEISRTGFKVKAPLACTVNYIVAYEN